MKDLERGGLRQALLDEVKAVCSTSGPEAVSIGKIGKRLGVSSGAPFRIFPSREHIFLALIESEMERLDQRFSEVLRDQFDSPEAQLIGLCAAYLEHAHQESAMFRLSFSLSAKALGAEDLQILGKRVYDKVRATVELCLTSARDSQEIERKTYLLWSTIHGHAMLKLTGQLDDQGIEIDNDVVIGDAVGSVLNTQRRRPA